MAPDFPHGVPLGSSILIVAFSAAPAPYETFVKKMQAQKSNEPFRVDLAVRRLRSSRHNFRLSIYY
jgi:hypothetical protein